jgi:Uma2 family endonuclease
MLMTADELLLLPDDGYRHELVNGELRTMTPSGSLHGVISARLARIVAPFVDERGLGIVFGAEAGFKIASDPDTVRAPDLAFVRRDRIPESGIPISFWPGAPDLAAEVISPGDTYEEVDAKVAAWLRAGTQMVWVVNPRRRTVAVHTGSGSVEIRSEGDELSGEPVLPGFSCAAAALFP